jgi:hypothetical protein
MLTPLQDALAALLRDGLPGLFGGSSPAVGLTFAPAGWTLDPSSADATAGEPAPDDARDVLAFDPAHPAGPYTLALPPYPAPRRVYLRTPAGDLAPLTPAEVAWDPADARKFTLQPRPSRPLEGYDAAVVLYGVTGVFTKLKTLHQLGVVLGAGDAEVLDRAEVLALAVLALNRDALMKAGAFTRTGGDYQAAGEVKSLHLRRGVEGGGERTLFLDAEVEVKVSRALRDDEGTPIERILSPGAAPGARRVDVRIGVEG